jgi:hypothetical protein
MQLSSIEREDDAESAEPAISAPSDGQLNQLSGMGAHGPRPRWIG